MTPRRQRMIFLGVLVLGVGAAVALVLMATRENLMYFYSPSQVLAGEVPPGARVRVGGLVVAGSVHRNPQDLRVRFALTDTQAQVEVAYQGSLPDLFREGQGVVAVGRIDGQGVLQADEVLAKHDEKYMPPEVAEALKMAQEGGAFVPNPHEPR